MIFANLNEGELVTPAFCPQTEPLSGWRDTGAVPRLCPRAPRTRHEGRSGRGRGAVEGRARLKGRARRPAQEAGGPAQDPRATLRGLGTQKPTTHATPPAPPWRSRSATSPSRMPEAAGRAGVPHTYYVGMSNLGFQTVYRLFNDSTTSSASASSCRRRRRWPTSSCAARAACPSSRRRPSRDFDVIAFSVSFEWDYTNVVTLLRRFRPANLRRGAIGEAPAGRNRGRRHLREPGAAGAVRRRDHRGRGRVARSQSGRGDARRRPASRRAPQPDRQDPASTPVVLPRRATTTTGA